jgi:acylphosphatase
MPTMPRVGTDRQAGSGRLGPGAGTSDVIRRRVLVRGAVQGVGFRISALHAARLRGVSGWIRNRHDGSVEAVFEGDPAAVESMVRWCEQGPRGAAVNAVEVVEEPPTGAAGFEIRP